MRIFIKLNHVETIRHVKFVNYVLRVRQCMGLPFGGGGGGEESVL
jgi:hypothetical protein